MRKRAREVPEPPPTIRRARAMLHDLAFDLTHPVQPGESDKRQHMDIYNCNNASVARGSDLFHFRIQFRPVLPKPKAYGASVRVSYVPTKSCHCHLVVLPATEHKSAESIGDMRFIVFETHAVQLDEQGDILCMWLTLENNQLRGPAKGSTEEQPPVLQPTVDPTYFMQEAFGVHRYKGLRFFPPSDEFDAGTLRTLSVDASSIPQRIPLWFKLRGIVTGSSLTELCGMYVPNIDKDSAEDIAKWTMNERTVFRGWRAADVRAGRLAEDKIVICYLNHYDHRSFQECGYYVHPDNPSEWGASPDGIIVDDAMDASRLPKSVCRDFDVSAFDVQRGVVEFKATRWQCTFKPYYVAQAMWEMQSTQVLWCDIVRYSSGRWALNADTGKWCVQGEQCRSYRLFRYAKADAMLQKCVKKAVACRAEGDKTAYLKLMQTKLFCNMRAYFERVTEKANAGAQDIPIDQPRLAQFKAFREQCCDNDEQASVHPVLERIEHRQYDLFNLFPDKEFIPMATQQVEDYMELIRSLWGRTTNA